MKIFSVIAALVFCCGLFVLHVVFFDYVVDDAFITFRYARNWADGHGIVFNPGERVEGYTNFLWMSVMALVIRIGVEPVAAARCLGIVAGAVLIGLVYFFLRRRLRKSSLALLGPLALAASGPLALWSGAGLETALFSLLAFSGVAAATDLEGGKRGFALGAILLLLAALARPEGVLFFSLCVVVRMLAGSSSLRERAAVVLPGLALFVLPLIPYEWWRVAYYGDWLPNTFFAKTGGGIDQVARGRDYLFHFLWQCGGWAYLLPLALFFFYPLRSWEKRILAVSAGYLVYVAAVGGDGLPFFRFMVPLLPFLVVLSVSAISRIAAGSGGTVDLKRAVLCGVVLVAPVYPSLTGPEREFVRDDRVRVGTYWTAIGKWLEKNSDPGDSIAVTTAGAIPYYSGLPTIDMLGMCDRWIARKTMPDMGKGIAGHEKHDIDYVLSRRPTIVIPQALLLPVPTLIEEQIDTPWSPGLAGLLDRRKFRNLYAIESVRIGSGYFTFFRLKERRTGK